jgi:hypothetical protein
MKSAEPNLQRVLDTLEKHHGQQKAAGPRDPYEMIVFVRIRRRMRLAPGDTKR